MDRVPLKSRAVVAAGYDAATHSLEVEFSSGRVYRFSEVPESVYAWLLRVPNKGVYITQNINGKYAHEDVTVTPPAEGAPDLEALLGASLSDRVDADR
jgi:hypothetical protein